MITVTGTALLIALTVGYFGIDSIVKGIGNLINSGKDETEDEKK